MADLEITRDRTGEFMVVQVEGVTDAGVEFVDGYCPVGVEFQVIDSGRIIVPEQTAEAIQILARERGLTTEVV
jgi:hypothetical protein